MRNRAKVVRNRHNLERVVRQAIVSLGETLEHAPPMRRRGRFNIAVDVRIEEVGTRGKVVASFASTHRTVHAFKR